MSYDSATQRQPLLIFGEIPQEIPHRFLVLYRRHSTFFSSYYFVNIFTYHLIVYETCLNMFVCVYIYVHSSF